MHRIFTLSILYLYGIINLISQQYELENYGLAHGLNSPKVETIIQDSQGFIWAGTYQGLSRFDGNEFINYTSAEGNRIGTIYSVLEVEKGVLILGGMEGLFLFANNVVKVIKWPTKESVTFSVNEITLDRYRNLWVASTLGPFKISRKNLDKIIANPHSLEQQFALSAWTNSNLRDKRCAKIKLDTFGNIWIANDYYFTNLLQDSLHILYDAYGKESLKISTIFPHSKDSVSWSAHQSFMYNTTDRITTKIWEPIQYPTKVVLHNGTYFALTAFELYNIKNNVPEKLIDTENEQVFFPRDLIFDSESNMWIASHSGLYKVKENKLNILPGKEQSLESALFGINLLKSRELILGGNHGKIYLLNPDQPSLGQLSQKLDTRSEIVSFHQDSNYKLWIASNYKGLFTKDAKGVKHYTEKDGLVNNGLRNIFKASNDDLWLAGELGATKITLDSNGEPLFKKYLYGNTVANYFQINQVFESPDKKPWFGSNFGLFRITDELLHPYTLDIENNEELYIFDCLSASNGMAYLATSQNGIIECRFDEKDQPVVNTLFNIENGVSTNTFVAILETSNGQIWATGYNEICLIKDPTKSQSLLPICYNKNNGYNPKPYSSIKMLEDDNGLIWLANPNGLMNIDPKALKLNEQAPYVHIYDILIDGRQEDLSPYGKDIDSVSGLVQELSLPFYKNYISFHINAISLRDLKDVKYNYQLIGVDKEQQSKTSGGIINYPNLSSGKYTFMLNASNTFGVTNPTPLSYSFEIRPAFWETKWFIALCLLFCFLGVRYYFKRKEAIYKKSEEEKNKINKLIAELKIKAIRSQMNPHFIFNCLNAIQSCILAQKSNIASTYLSKFSKLLRMVLDYAEKDFIWLEKEIEFLKLYLDLEKLRFGKSLEFSIELDSKLDPEEILVPSFLIQPFVENSIWHGLMHKSDNRKLWIKFNQNNETLLQCIIEDNGIGRDKSASLKRKNKSTIQHQSKGMRLSTERIELIKLQSGEKINFIIEDLKDNNYTPIGTKVTLNLPMNYEN